MALLAPVGHADEWHTSAALYAELAASKGQISAGVHFADLQSDDRLDGTELLGLLTLRNENERIAITAGAAFAAGNAEFVDPQGTLHDADLTHEMIEATWSWRLGSRYEILAGLRYQTFGADISSRSADGGSAASFDARSWLDPIVGARITWPLAETCTLLGRFDIGGFDVGSQLTWSALFAIDWKVSKHVGFIVGYRALDTDYAGGSGESRFEFDVLSAGPLVGVRFDLGTE